MDVVLTNLYYAVKVSLIITVQCIKIPEVSHVRMEFNFH